MVSKTILFVPVVLASMKHDHHSILEANSGASVSANANLMQQLFTQKGVKFGEDGGHGVFEWMASRTTEETQRVFDELKKFSALESTSHHVRKVRGDSILEANSGASVAANANLMQQLFTQKGVKFGKDGGHAVFDWMAGVTPQESQQAYNAIEQFSKMDIASHNKHKVRGGHSILEANAGASVAAKANLMQQLFTQKGVEFGEDGGHAVFEWMASRTKDETQEVFDQLKSFSALESTKVRGDSILEANAGASVTADANVMQQLFTQQGVEMGDDEGRGVFEWMANRSPRETQQVYDGIKMFSALESTQQKKLMNSFKNQKH